MSARFFCFFSLAHLHRSPSFSLALLFLTLNTLLFSRQAHSHTLAMGDQGTVMTMDTIPRFEESEYNGPFSPRRNRPASQPTQTLKPVSTPSSPRRGGKAKGQANSASRQPQARQSGIPVSAAGGSSRGAAQGKRGRRSHAKGGGAVSDKGVSPSTARPAATSSTTTPSTTAKSTAAVAFSLPGKTPPHPDVQSRLFGSALQGISPSKDAVSRAGRQSSIPRATTATSNSGSGSGASSQNGTKQPKSAGRGSKHAAKMAQTS